MHENSVKKMTLAFAALALLATTAGCSSQAKLRSDYDDSIERFESRLAQREETLIARFSNLEQIVSGLQGQQGFLGSLG